MFRDWYYIIRHRTSVIKAPLSCHHSPSPSVLDVDRGCCRQLVEKSSCPTRWVQLSVSRYRFKCATPSAERSPFGPAEKMKWLPCKTFPSATRPVPLNRDSAGHTKEWVNYNYCSVVSSMGAKLPTSVRIFLHNLIFWILILYSTFCDRHYKEQSRGCRILHVQVMNSYIKIII